MLCAFEVECKTYLKWGHALYKFKTFPVFFSHPTDVPTQMFGQDKFGPK